jgi:peptidoglycan/LPS O-acetylase OafA/YrhL
MIFRAAKEPNSGHFWALDSLRGICAIIVVLLHLETSTSLFKPALVRNGFLFVDFFFVLSGFVIYSSYGERLTTSYPASKFLLLRLGRLYPIHLFMLLASLAIAISKSQFGVGRYPLSSFILSLTLSNAWQPTVGDGAWNQPSWSISAEFWMYALFAAACRMMKRFSVLAAASLISISAILLIETHSYLTSNGSFIAFARCAFGFSFGILAYKGWSSDFFAGLLTRLNGRRWLFSAIEIAAVICCIALVSLAGTSWLSMLCPALFALMVVIFASERGLLSSILLTRPMMLLGLLSYSIYMVHEFIIARFINTIQVLSKHMTLPVTQHPTHSFELINANGWAYGVELATALILLAVIGASYLTYRYVEAPCREWSRRMLATPPPLAGRAPTPHNEPAAV